MNLELRDKIDLSSGKYVKIWQGPQHPGITGNMAVELIVQGDTVHKLTTHIGYLHRGFEKLMERRRYIQCFPIVCRICVPEPDFNEYLLATATEDLAGIEIPEKAKWLRALVLEMGRLTGFLLWLGGQAGSLGMGTIAQWTVTHRDYILDLFEELTGGRVYHMYQLPGGVRGDLPEGFKERAEKVMQKVEKILDEIYKVLFNNAVFKMRTKGIGVITKEMVDEYGIVGPTARATGLKRDVRKDMPYLIYDKLDFEVITGTISDIYGRAEVRYKEMLQTISLIRQILKYMPDGGEVFVKQTNPLNWKIPAGETYVAAESSRGEFGYYMVSDGTEYPRRINVRGASYTHAMALLEDLAVGANIADIAALMVSIQTCPPEIDR